MNARNQKLRRTIESLSHFSCPKCRKWWTIGDAPTIKREWFCPWCGAKSAFTATIKKAK